MLQDGLSAWGVKEGANRGLCGPIPSVDAAGTTNRGSGNNVVSRKKTVRRQLLKGLEAIAAEHRRLPPDVGLVRSAPLAPYLGCRQDGGDYQPRQKRPHYVSKRDKCSWLAARHLVTSSIGLIVLV